MKIVFFKKAHVRQHTRNVKGKVSVVSDYDRKGEKAFKLQAQSHKPSLFDKKPEVKQAKETIESASSESGILTVEISGGLPVLASEWQGKKTPIVFKKKKKIDAKIKELKGLGFYVREVMGPDRKGICIHVSDKKTAPEQVKKKSASGAGKATPDIEFLSNKIRHNGRRIEYKTYYGDVAVKKVKDRGYKWNPENKTWWKGYSDGEAEFLNSLVGKKEEFKERLKDYILFQGGTYAVKDELKKLGAVFDKSKKGWLVPPDKVNEAIGIIALGTEKRGNVSSKQALRDLIEITEDMDNFREADKLRDQYYLKYGFDRNI